MITKIGHVLDVLHHQGSARSPACLRSRMMGKRVFEFICYYSLLPCIFTFAQMLKNTFVTYVGMKGFKIVALTCFNARM
jgi:hypothetical protein